MNKKDPIEQFLEYYRKHMPKNVYLVENTERLEEAVTAINTITELVYDCDETADVSIRANKLTGTTLCMRIISNLIVFDHKLKDLADAIRVADTFEVCPMADGRIDLGFTFQNCYKTATPSED